MDHIATILANWGIDCHKAEQIYVSAWRIDDNYILKTGKDVDSIRRHIAITNCLRRFGIPVAEIVPTLEKDALLIADGNYYLLSKRLPGKHIENIYDQDYCLFARRSGEVIANLHRALQVVQQEIQCWDNNLLDEMQGWIKAFFDASGYSLISQQEFDASVYALEKMSNFLPKQLIHRDIHFGNLLFENGDVTGYIDFDLSQINYRIFDICYFALGLLIDGFAYEDKSAKWFQMLKNIIQGYESISMMTCEEKQAAVSVMECIELLFTAYFFQNGNLALAENAANMFYWIRKNEKRIEAIFCYA
jgi:Ser/Thr protein kinase RdoA (MazF antagonist)